MQPAPTLGPEARGESKWSSRVTHKHRPRAARARAASDSSGFVQVVIDSGAQRGRGAAIVMRGACEGGRRGSNGVRVMTSQSEGQGARARCWLDGRVATRRGLPQQDLCKHPNVAQRVTAGGVGSTPRGFKDVPRARAGWRPRQGRANGWDGCEQCAEGASAPDVFTTKWQVQIAVWFCPIWFQIFIGGTRVGRAVGGSGSRGWRTASEDSAATRSPRPTSTRPVAGRILPSSLRI